MAGFLRSIAPAVLVGTAAVTVVAAADDGANSLLTADNLNPVPDSSVTAAAGGAQDRDSEHDEEPESDDDADDGVTTNGISGGTAATAPTSPSQPSTPATSSCADAAEVTGPIVRTEWGPVQVAATVSNGRVCAVRTIVTPDGDRKSVMINARAVPALEAQVLAAGNASFDGVSGATVTSDGYRSSLQAILDAS